MGGLYDSPYESSVSYDVGEIGYFWSASEDDSFDAYYMYIKDQDDTRFSVTATRASLSPSVVSGTISKVFRGQAKCLTNRCLGEVKFHLSRRGIPWTICLQNSFLRVRESFALVDSISGFAYGVDSR